MNRKEAIVVSAMLLASFVGSVFADSVATAPNSSSGCNTKCLINNLERPVVTGNFSLVDRTGTNIFCCIIAGGVTNYGTRTAFSVNMTLSWTRTYISCSVLCTTTVNLGVFSLGNITGRNTVPFSIIEAQSENPPPFIVDSIDSTFVWNGT